MSAIENNDDAVEMRIVEWLAIRKEAGLQIDPDTAEVCCRYAQVLDPYGIYPNLPEQGYCVGRFYFARSRGTDVCVEFGDLPQSTQDALWLKHRNRLAFPTGVPTLNDEG
jgi:hypothetical protein